MTAEKRILISPRDILSVGYECPHCRATYFVPLARLDRVAIHCPNCRERWASDTQPSSSEHSDAKVLEFFVHFLHELCRRDFGSHLRFEIDGEIKMEAKL